MEKNTKKVISLFIIFAILIELYVCFGVIINYILSMVLTMIFGYLIYPIVVLIFLILVPTLIVFIFKKKNITFENSKKAKFAICLIVIISLIIRIIPFAIIKYDISSSKKMIDNLQEYAKTSATTFDDLLNYMNLSEKELELIKSNEYVNSKILSVYGQTACTYQAGKLCYCIAENMFAGIIINDQKFVGSSPKVYSNFIKKYYLTEDVWYEFENSLNNNFIWSVNDTVNAIYIVATIYEALIFITFYFAFKQKENM